MTSFQAVSFALGCNTLVACYAFTVLEKRSLMTSCTNALSFLFFLLTLRRIHRHWYKPYGAFLLIFVLTLRWFRGPIAWVVVDVVFASCNVVFFSPALSDENWPYVSFFGVVVVIAVHIIVVTHIGAFTACCLLKRVSLKSSEEKKKKKKKKKEKSLHTEREKKKKKF
ncbi:hypothetical protein RM700_277 [Saccharomyces cerevisiae synthetic construct]|uniref:Putative uncharacterized protein YKR040C n=1 Tax=Saccharomyces cerevisiae (strain ATCC 204508 / S288c) TaxID=559292 RepID=YK20_YEAST|nr:RecName: Full=Putative uncharacterized protein YKR040C [Saccharomyces cerevisiae S288C]WNV94359.1 hypothetical protein RM700_277 [Saccharomyces cerevisiae synthetic construct]CAA82114.1 unnamed protein product [Saccharomyces cerevisiae]